MPATLRLIAVTARIRRLPIGRVAVCWRWTASQPETAGLPNGERSVTIAEPLSRSEVDRSKHGVAITVTAGTGIAYCTNFNSVYAVGERSGIRDPRPEQFNFAAPMCRRRNVSPESEFR